LRQLLIAARSASAFIVEAAGVRTAAGLGFVVAEPAGDLVAGPFEEAAVVIAVAGEAIIATVAEIVAEPATRFTPSSAAFMSIISHGNSSLFGPARPLWD
jgi:hypothetical protein